MHLNKSWNSKNIINYLNKSRSNFNDLYEGEKFLIKNFIKNDSNVLDIGCAQGGMYKILKKKFSKIKYTGLDFNKKMIDIAKKNFPNQNFYYYNGTNYKSFLKKKFDVVVIFGILHLNKNWKNILYNASKITKKYILFDLREQFKDEGIKNLFYLHLDFKKKSKKFLVPYIILDKKKLNIFFEKKFKSFSHVEYSYLGNISKYASQKNRIKFSNYCFKKNA
jgi:ubiquinone/menaquinone biosynthesis C-methylase UbiE